MINIFSSILLGTMTMIALDYSWLAKIAKKFYLENLSRHITIENGSLVVNIYSALVVYAVGIFSIFYFVTIRSNSLSEAGIKGMILGLSMYAFYDFTNSATMHSFPLKLALIDTLWGGFILGTVSLVMYYFYTKS